ncbi:unnamed protein product [Lasius platythorax]|uniref:Uncharacterized protein n=1 Tax=Lasius platythorax TaxID=488582 RepID=A0AAV2P2L6_9HYME
MRFVDEFNRSMISMRTERKIFETCVPGQFQVDPRIMGLSLPCAGYPLWGGWDFRGAFERGIQKYPLRRLHVWGYL